MASNSNPTQAEMILGYLHQHGSITPLEALQHLGCMRLGARIWELRHNQGIRIKRELVSRVNQSGKRSTFARYELVDKEEE